MQLKEAAVGRLGDRRADDRARATPRASQLLRTALAMGADQAIHVVGTDLPSPATSWPWHEILAAAIRHVDEADDFDLVHLRQADHRPRRGRAGAGAGRAARPRRTWGPSPKLDLADDASGTARIRARRRMEGADEVLEATLPIVLLTCEKGLVEPRYPALPQLIKAKKKPDGDGRHRPTSASPGARGAGGARAGASWRSRRRAGRSARIIDGEPAKPWLANWSACPARRGEGNLASWRVDVLVFVEQRERHRHHAGVAAACSPRPESLAPTRARPSTRSMIGDGTSVPIWRTRSAAKHGADRRSTSPIDAELEPLPRACRTPAPSVRRDRGIRTSRRSS